jgi:Flp pilus assembly protein TadG
MRAFARVLKRIITQKAGQATLIVGLAMPALIGAAGFTVDLAQVYIWKRELQHSVDQAAMAGAWTLVYNSTSTKYTTRALQEYNANQVYTASFDATPSVQLGSYGGGTNNSVIVSSSVTKKLPFSGYLINNSLTVSATAQATFAQGGTYQACLMALKKGAGSTFTIGGSSTVTASCGLGALSCEPDSIVISGGTVTTDSIVTCGTATVPTSLQSKVTEYASGISNPFEDLPPPSPPSESAKSLNCPANGKGTQNITPGRYTGGFNVTCKVVMAKGVYVIDGGVMDLTSNKGDITGTGVLFVLRNGAQMVLGGSGNGGLVNLSPMEAADFVGTANETHKNKYAGMIVYEDTTGQTTPVDHKFNGNADVSVRGTFYLPNGDLTVNGNGNTAPLCFQLWASTLKITGNASITTTCTNSQTNSAGSSVGGVRLVA